MLIKFVRTGLLLSSIMLFGYFQINAAGMDCRSMLSSHISPLFGSKYIVGGIEVTGAIAGMTDRNVKNGLAIAGLGFNFDDSKHQIYVEGGYKNFYNSKGGPGRQGKDSSGISPSYEKFAAVDKKHWGFRELYYKFTLPEFSIGAGLQTLKLQDYLLVDERVVGVNSKYKSGDFEYSATAASVLAQFARYADFCGTRHIYNLTRGGRVDFLGQNFGESNFFAASVKWINNPESSNPESSSPVKPKPEASNTTEDEFEDFSPISEASSKPFVQEVGAIFYNEFGSVFPDYKYYGGFFSKFNLPLDLELKTELLYQYVYKENALGYFVELNKNFDWSDGYNTLVGAAMVGKFDIDANSMFYPSFTNLFMGEVMKMDALDLPVVQAYAKTDFPWFDNMYFKVQYAGQTAGYHTKEIDLELSARFLDHFKTTFIGGYITSEKLNQDTYFARMEIRIAL